MGTLQNFIAKRKADGVKTKNGKERLVVLNRVAKSIVEGEVCIERTCLRAYHRKASRNH
jgi:hypothetical protein